MKAKLIKQELGYILFDEKGIPIGHTPNVLNNNTFSKLSLKNCQAIERGYDLDDIKRKVFDGFDGQPDSFTIAAVERTIQIMFGLVGDKKFTEMELEIIWDRSADFRHNPTEENSLKQCIKEIQEREEWEVEVEMQKVKDETKIIGAVKGVKGSGNKITTYKSVPKLDADGCLILKRVI